MKVLAKEAFRDYTEGVFRQKGDEFEVTKKRYEEMVAGLPEGYVEALSEDEESKPSKKTKTKKGE